MTYGRPHNPWKLPRTKVREFDGIGGPPVQILKRFNDRGWDISGTISNELEDGHLGEKGSMILRPGWRRAGSEDYSIGWLGQINIGGLLRYALIWNNGLSVVDLPRGLGYEILDWPEEDPAEPSEWPADWDWETVVLDDHLTEDPSLPVENQTCAISWSWDSSPASLSFTQPYAGAVSPSSQSWFWRGEGFRTEVVFGLYTGDAAWFDSALIQGGGRNLAPCKSEQWGGIVVTPTGKDASDNWLDPGTYSSTKSVTMSDGTTLEVTIVLTVTPAVPAFTITPTSDSDEAIEDAAGNVTSAFNISNSGEADSTLNWELVSITGDAALTAIMSLSSESGSLAYDADEDITVTITNPGALDPGAYSATVNVRDSVQPAVTDTWDYSLTVLAAVPAACPYSGNVSMAISATTQLWYAPYDDYTMSGTVNQTGNWCRWVVGSPYGSDGVIVERVDAAPGGNVEGSGTAWSTVLAGVSFPCWLSYVRKYVGSDTYVIEQISTKGSGTTPVGSVGSGDGDYVDTGYGSTTPTISVTAP